MSTGSAAPQANQQEGKKERPGWFDENPSDDRVSEAGRELLENYSGIPPDKVTLHVVDVRDRAFDIWPYACIGQFRFLNYSIAKQPYYQTVLEKLKSGGTFLDAGCCFGQELRFLNHREGIPGKQLYGFDLEKGFVDFGYELFRDRDRLGATLASGNLLAAHDAPEAQELNTLDGKIDVVHCSSVLHLWDWDQMLQASKRLASFTRPIAGSMIIGTQMGSRNAGSYPTPPMPSDTGFNYRHNEESMEKFWAQVGEETGTKWKVESQTFVSPAITENLKHAWAKVDPGMCMIWFKVTRMGDNFLELS